jgi:integrase
LDVNFYVTWPYSLAQDLTPCIVFIEDIDLIGQNREEFGYQRGNALLSLLAVLDGIEENNGIITVATTNCLDTLDKALSQRPSRFDCVIKLSRPSIAQRKELISRLCQKIPLDEQTQEYIAAKTENFTPAELSAILADKNPYQDLYRFAVETGDRRNEVIAAQRQDFVVNDGRYGLWVARSYDARRKCFKVPKNKKKRFIDLFPGTVQVIQRRLPTLGKPEDLIFPGKNGRPIYPTTITHDFQDLLKKLGIPGHCFHDLRHTCATYLLNNGWSVAEVARRLGHRDASVTARVYANWLPGQAGRLIQARPDVFGAQSGSTVPEAKKKPVEAMVGDSGFEPETPVLSGLCSNQLS